MIPDVTIHELRNSPEGGFFLFLLLLSSIFNATGSHAKGSPIFKILMLYYYLPAVHFFTPHNLANLQLNLSDACFFERRDETRSS